MALGERGNFDEPRKSAWNFEVYDSSLERRMMERPRERPIGPQVDEAPRHLDRAGSTHGTVAIRTAPTFSSSTSTAHSP